MTSAQRVAWTCLLLCVALVPTVVGTMPFGPQLSLNPFTATPVALLAVLTAAAVIAWLYALLKEHGAVRAHRAMIGMGVFLILAAASTVFSLDPLYSLFGDGDDLQGLFAYVSCLLLTIATVALCTSSKRLSALTSTLIGAGFAVALIALLQQFFGIDVFGEVPLESRSQLGWMLSQGSSTLGNPDFTGAFLVVPSILAAARALRREDDMGKLLARGGIAVAIGSALILTLSRGAWIALAIGVVGWIIVSTLRSGSTPRLPWPVVVLASLAAVVIVTYAGPDLMRRFTELAGGGIHGLRARTLIWAEALNIIKQHPLLGTGPAAFRLGWYAVRDIAGLAVGAGAVATDAHSVPLMIAATMGIPALIALAVTWIWTLIASAKLALGKSERASLDYIAWWVAMAAVSVLLLSAMITIQLLLVLFLGLGVLLAPLAKPIVPKGAARQTLVVAIGILALLGAWSGATQGISHLSARTALAASPSDLSRVTSRLPWSGSLGLLAARLTGESALSGPAVSNPQAIQQTLNGAYGVLASRHPNDYEIASWWSIQLLMAGDLTNDSSLLQEGLRLADRAIALYPNSLVMRTNRARAFLDLGQPQKASNEMAGLEGADPNYPAAQQVISDIEASLKR